MYHRPCCLWLGLLLCAGCFPDKNAYLPDAAAADPGAGAAGRGTVYVTVLDPAGSGIHTSAGAVVFIDPDGTVVKQSDVDAAGTAYAEVLPGASVTAITQFQGAMQYDLHTVLGVKPGDHLVLGTKKPDESLDSYLTISYPPYPGATRYLVAHPCGVASTTGTAVRVAIKKSCRQKMMELTVIAVGNKNKPLASIASAGIAFTSSYHAAITGSYQPLGGFTASYTNIHPPIDELDMTRAVPDAWGLLDSAQARSPQATATLEVSGAQGSASEIISRASASTGAYQTVHQVIAGTAARYDLDLAATLLPWLGKPTLDVAHGKLIVPVDGNGTSQARPDLFKVTFYYHRNGVIIGWTIFGPEATDIALPPLPLAFAQLAPSAADDFANVSEAWMLEADSVAGYDAVREDAGAVFDLYASARWPATATATTVRISIAP